MRLWVIRYPDNTYLSGDFDARTSKLTLTRVDNVHRAYTWREEQDAKRTAKSEGGVAVPFDMNGGEMTEAVSKERAEQIWRDRGPMGEWPKGSYTSAEGAYIRKVWDAMDGSACWSDALLKIARGEA